MQRPVHGELLCDEAGRLYERIGRRIRPLHQVLSGPGGQILDVVPMKERPEPPVLEYRRFSQNGTDSPSESAPPTTIPGPVGEPSYRKLVADPGLWRVVLWGEFKALMGGQIACPERLRDTHRLPCCVQVFEAMTTQSLTSLAGTALGDLEKAKELHQLNDLLVSRLGLRELLEMRSPSAPIGRSAPGLLMPGDLVVHLRVAQDPTVAASKIGQADEAFGGAGRPGSSSCRQPQQDTGVLRKTTISERFAKPWEFQFSREEVQYDLEREAAGRSVLKRWLKRLVRWSASRREIRKWQTLLQGKPIEEQLWSVRPPKHDLWNRVVREWVKNTLHLAGYDPGVMPVEWEIFWRRRGL
jgi:hypothetical protein